MLLLRRSSTLGLLLGLVGCDSLLNHPGRDFAVTVDTPMPLVVSQQATPTELSFAVRGCGEFVASLATRTHDGSVSTELEVTRRDDGHYAAQLPAKAFASENSCGADARRPRESGAQLTIRCNDESRDAVANVTVSYAPAYRSFYAGRGAVDAVFPARAPGAFFAVGSGWLSYFDGLDDSSTDAVAAVEPNVRPRLAQTADTAYLWVGCPLDSCGIVWIVDTPEYKSGTSATYLIPFDASKDGRLDRASAPIPVPGGVEAMTVTPQGNVALLSTLTRTVVLTTVRDRAVSKMMELKEEQLPTEFARLAGEQVFLTVTTSSSAVRLHTVTGALAGEYALQGSGAVTYLSLAPSGDQWLYVRNNEVHVGGVDANRTAVPDRLLRTQLGRPERFGAAWLTNHVVLWNDAQGVLPELHSRTADTSPVVLALEASRESPTVVRSGFGLDHAAAIVTATGVEIFDESGRSIGGAEPFDASCGRRNGLFGNEAAVIDGETLAVGGQTYVSLFRPGAR